MWKYCRCLFYKHQFAENIQICIYWNSLGKLQLKIKRTVRTKTHCCFPNCRAFQKLKRLSTANRQFITVNEKVYIPPNAVVCDEHEPMNIWRNCGSLIENDAHDFTKALVEDMFQLLTSPHLSLHTDLSTSKWTICDHYDGIKHVLYRIIIYRFGMLRRWADAIHGTY